ncbi:hypothetical protein BDZ94DRAFT_1278486 [Collybia nuda]|uniref:Uncharacterized protein n=1 Tax=Collybia nuda TaxID=64659 RepID=A0A9P5XRK8_9AGAR|nr:hypothetical protein BDZ94DRAFT_1278486 [Collybia nuda]
MSIKPSGTQPTRPTTRAQAPGLKRARMLDLSGPSSNPQSNASPGPSGLMGKV